MFVIVETKLPCTTLLLPVFIELRVGDDRLDLALVPQGELLTGGQLLLVSCGDGKNHGDRLVGQAIVEKTVEMLTLKKLPFSHESCQLYKIQVFKKKHIHLILMHRALFNLRS